MQKNIKNLKKIIISGSVFSGKQTALHILDNNQDIMINLIHDKMINSLRYLYSLENAKVNNSRNKLIIFEKGKKKVELSEDNLNYSLKNTSKHQLARTSGATSAVMLPEIERSCSLHTPTKFLQILKATH